MTIFLLVSALPLSALAWVALRDLPMSWAELKGPAKTILLLFCIGLYVAQPFLGSNAMGTGEAYNYSLAIADGVTQFRAGEFPVLVGQSEYAFNGRIHPLRTAPYYVYAAGLLDLLTLRKLDFWSLQNLLLSLSLIGATFSMYAALRYLIGASRCVSVVGTTLYIISPGVLSVTYSMDLFMTVTTLPYLPLIVGANVRSMRERSIRVYVLMGTALALTWAAHPPIAFWISVATVALQAVAWLTQRPTVRAIAALAVGAVTGGLLAAFPFASTLTMQDGGGLAEAHDFSPMFVELKRVFPASLFPVSARADLLSDFQLGYTHWGLLIAALIGVVLRPRAAVLALCGFAAFLLLLLIPLGDFTPWLWTTLPPVFSNITNIWPMQRLYLITTVVVIFAAVALWPQLDAVLKTRPKIISRLTLVIVASAVAWSAWQSRPFLHRGKSFQKGRQASRDLHRSENIDLTVISYAMLGVPSHFHYGVADPHAWFRILKADDKTEIANNWSVAAPGTTKAQGSFRSTRTQADGVSLSPGIRLQPGKKYWLVFTFRSPPLNGQLILAGERFYRQQTLPSSSQPRGFGMLPGNHNALPLWTTNPGGEDVRLRLVGPGVAKSVAGGFADFTLYEVDPARLPVEVENLVPLRGKLRVNEDAWVETPRRFIPGYAASVDGRKADVSRSPEGAVMIRVVPGARSFELRYPGPPALRAAFWTSLASALALAAFASWRLVSFGRQRFEKRGISRAAATPA
jgi:hypothetical protein